MKIMIEEKKPTKACIECITNLLTFLYKSNIRNEKQLLKTNLMEVFCVIDKSDLKDSHKLELFRLLNEFIQSAKEKQVFEFFMNILDGSQIYIDSLSKTTKSKSKKDKKELEDVNRVHNEEYTPKPKILTAPESDEPSFFNTFNTTNNNLKGAE